MSSSHPDVKFTYHDCLLLPEDKQYELIDGDLHMVPAPSPWHQAISGSIYAELRSYVKQQEIGEVLIAPCDVYLSLHDVVQPDILYISSERLGIIRERYVEGAPDLLIEILSPSSHEKDRTIKRKLYRRYGVREYWMVDPEAKAIEVLVRTSTAFETFQTFTSPDRLMSPLMKEFHLDLVMVFRPVGCKKTLPRKSTDDHE